MRILIVLVTAATLGACAAQPRTEPPAPIVQRGVETPAPVQPAAPPEPKVEVYAYRPPAGAPDAIGGEPPAEPGYATELTPTDTVGPQTAWSLPAERPAERQPERPVAPPSEGPASPPAPTVSDAEPNETVAAVAPTATRPALAPAADVLVRQAEQQRQGGDYVGAAATLERALRIQPQEPYLWNRLARVRLEQGLPGQAGNLAARSNALASDAALKQDNWAVIAAARRAAGDVAGAEEADRRAQGG